MNNNRFLHSTIVTIHATYTREAHHNTSIEGVGRPAAFMLGISLRIDTLMLLQQANLVLFAILQDGRPTRLCDALPPRPLTFTYK